MSPRPQRSADRIDLHQRPLQDITTDLGGINHLSLESPPRRRPGGLIHTHDISHAFDFPAA